MILDNIIRSTAQIIVLYNLLCVTCHESGITVKLAGLAILSRSALAKYLGMNFGSISAFGLILFGLLSSLIATLPPDSLTANLTSRFMHNLGPMTNASNILVNDKATAPLRDRTGCFTAQPGLRTVTPQDAFIALGRLAFPRDFYTDRVYQDNTVIKEFRSASIALIKNDVGPDAFSLFNIASQAIEIIKFCIVQQTPQNWLGGLLEVGSRNRFRVVVHGQWHFDS